MVKPEWGMKHTCQHCGAIFYDMRKSPATCPKCGAEQEQEKPRARRGAAAAAAAAAADPSTLGATANWTNLSTFANRGGKLVTVAPKGSTTSSSIPLDDLALMSS